MIIRLLNLDNRSQIYYLIMVALLQDNKVEQAVNMLNKIDVPFRDLALVRLADDNAQLEIDFTVMLTLYGNVRNLLPQGIMLVKLLQFGFVKGYKSTADLLDQAIDVMTKLNSCTNSVGHLDVEKLAGYGVDNNPDSNRLCRVLDANVSIHLNYIYSELTLVLVLFNRLSDTISLAHDCPANAHILSGMLNACDYFWHEDKSQIPLLLQELLPLISQVENTDYKPILLARACYYLSRSEPERAESLYIDILQNDENTTENLLITSFLLRSGLLRFGLMSGFLSALDHLQDYDVGTEGSVRTKYMWYTTKLHTSDILSLSANFAKIPLETRLTLFAENKDKYEYSELMSAIFPESLVFQHYLPPAKFVKVIDFVMRTQNENVRGWLMTGLTYAIDPLEFIDAVRKKSNDKNDSFDDYSNFASNFQSIASDNMIPNDIWTVAYLTLPKLDTAVRSAVFDEVNVLVNYGGEDVSNSSEEFRFDNNIRSDDDSDFDDDFDFDFDDDFDFDFDDFIVDNDPLPEQSQSTSNNWWPLLLQYYAKCLVEDRMIRDVLSTVVRISQKFSTDKFIKANLARSVAEAYGSSGEYHLSISVALLDTMLHEGTKERFLTIISTMYSDDVEDDCWLFIAKSALVNDEVEKYIDAISQHRATQARILAFAGLCIALLFTDDERANDVFEHLVQAIKHLKRNILRGDVLAVLAVCLALVNVEKFPILHGDDLEPFIFERHRRFSQTLLPSIVAKNVELHNLCMDAYRNTSSPYQILDSFFVKDISQRMIMLLLLTSNVEMIKDWSKLCLDATSLKESE